MSEKVKVKLGTFFFFKPWKSMFKPGRKGKQIFRVLFSNHTHKFRMMIEEVSFSVAMSIVN